MANMLTVQQDPNERMNEDTANCQLYVRIFYLFIYLFTESFTNTARHDLIDNRRVDIQNLVSQRRKDWAYQRGGTHEKILLLKGGEAMKLP